MKMHFTVSVEVDKYELDKLDDCSATAVENGAWVPLAVLGEAFADAAMKYYGVGMSVLKTSMTGQPSNLREME